MPILRRTTRRKTRTCNAGIVRRLSRYAIFPAAGYTRLKLREDNRSYRQSFSSRIAFFTGFAPTPYLLRSSPMGGGIMVPVEGDIAYGAEL